MERVVVLGRGGAGKTTFARRLAAATGLPVTELDEKFWSDSLQPLSADEWTAVQTQLVESERWILDGDLGPYDVLDVRLAAADTVVILDFPLLICAWRALRRSRETREFWRWLVFYRRAHLPKILNAVSIHCPAAEVHAARSPRAVSRFLGAYELRSDRR